MVPIAELRAEFRSRMAVDPDTDNSWEQALLSLDAATHYFWALALICYFVIDLATTLHALAIPGYSEANPLAVYLLAHYGAAGVIIGKLTVLGLAYTGWRRTPRPVAVAFPLGIATIGLLATVNNFIILLR